MSVVVLGLNHRTVPLSLLERVTVPDHALVKALHDVGSRSHVSEAVVLSTCNRTEVYVVAERFHGAYVDLRDFFCDLGSLAPEDLHDHFYSQHDDEAVRHLFDVAAGLDSDVIGESEILGQVRSAWEVARDAGTARAALNLLFRHAVEVGKRARTETGIARSTASVSHAAVEMATELLGGLGGRRVLVVGAGAMGEGMVVALTAAGVAEVVVANRTTAHGERLAARVGGRAVGFHELARELGHADLLLACTGAGTLVVDHDLVGGVMADRADRPLLVVDIGVPRTWTQR